MRTAANKALGDSGKYYYTIPMTPSDPAANPLAGILLYAKPAGLTSFASLYRVKKALGTRKIGHTGTLDSFAEGLLVLLVGRYTKLVQHITGMDKQYRAVIRFGSETDTLDPTGTVTAQADMPAEAAFRAALPQFTGTIPQTPPAYSAIHINGKRASDLARSGKEVEMEAREVTIHSIDVLDFSGDTATIDVHCSKGTYIRSLARDIARACGSRAHLAALTRTAVGPFTLAEALSPADSDESLRAAVAGRTSALEQRLGLGTALIRRTQNAQTMLYCAGL
jgi:tRNA pseudouridine55 synthase